MFDLYVQGTALEIFFGLWGEAVRSKASPVPVSLFQFFPLALLLPGAQRVLLFFLLNKFFSPFS